MTCPEVTRERKELRKYRKGRTKQVKKREILSKEEGNN
jgi:hypothetical protein